MRHASRKMLAKKPWLNIACPLCGALAGYNCHQMSKHKRGVITPYPPGHDARIKTYAAQVGDPPEELEAADFAPLTPAELEQVRPEIKSELGLKMLATLDAALDVLRNWERWEADLILKGDWSGSTVKYTQALHDALTPLQEARNRVLHGK